MTRSLGKGGLCKVNFLLISATRGKSETRKKKTAVSLCPKREKKERKAIDRLISSGALGEKKNREGRG